MKLRPAQLVLLLLLGASLRLAHANALPNGEYGFGGRYLGVLVCDDCAGVWSDLILKDHGVNWGDGEGDFILVERFTGGAHTGETITLLGDWSAVHWERDRNYTGTLELRPFHLAGTPAPTPFYFSCDHGRSLSQLDANRQSLSPLKPATLDRVIPPPEPRFVVTASESGTTLHARIGDTFILQLPVASLAAYRTAWTMKPPAAQCMTVYSITGSGNQGVFTSDFELKAAAPGKVHLDFQNAEQPTRSLAYDFEVLP